MVAVGALPSSEGYLGVTADGGKLKQRDTTLAWDSDGYYEVTLDAGSLTLFP